MSRKVVLSLSSGGSLGYAHIGVLKALIESGVDIVAIAGTSMGGIVAGLFSLGISPYDIEDMFLSMMSNASVLASALFAHLRISVGPMAILRDILQDIKIKHARIPVFIYATDMYTRKPYLFEKEESMFVALRATSAIPGTFPPVKYKGMYLVDGGIALPLPADRLLEYKEEDMLAIGVDVYGGMLVKTRHKKIKVIDAYAVIMSRHARCRGRRLDIILSPDLTGFNNLMYSSVRDIVERGYIAGSYFVERLYKRGLL